MSDKSLGPFIRRRLGNETWQRLVEPLMAGIYAADRDTLSLAATFPQLREAELRHGALIRGVIASRPAAAPSTAPARAAFLTPRNGLGELFGAHADRLEAQGVTVRTGTPANGLTTSGDCHSVHLAGGETIEAADVITAAPAFAAADLITELDRQLAADLAAIPHASTAIVSLTYRSGEIPGSLDSHGYLIPRVEGGPILACTWSSRK